jgi:hypothetical protein
VRRGAVDRGRRRGARVETNALATRAMRWTILFVAIAARAIGAGASADGRFAAALALARRLARSVGGGDDERIAPVNGRLYDVFGVVAVPKCFPRCAAADAPRPEVRETWAATRDDLLASAPNEIEAAVERFLSRFETAKEPTGAHGDALLVNDERVRAFFADAVDVESV